MHSMGGSPSSRCRSACSSSTNCRATPWARYRRIFCGIRITTSILRIRSANESRLGIMNREQAVRSQKHLLDADAALNHARMAIAGLGKVERLTLDGFLREAVDILHLDMLAQIYDQYPDLEPPARDD